MDLWNTVAAISLTLTVLLQCCDSDPRRFDATGHARLALPYNAARHFRIRPSCHAFPVPKLAQTNLVTNHKKFIGKWYGYLTYSPDLERSAMPLNFVTCLRDPQQGMNGLSDSVLFRQNLFGYFETTKYFTSQKSFALSSEPSREYRFQSSNNLFCNYPPEIAHECPNNVIVLDTDYHTYLLLYECQLADIQLNICLSPLYILYTREKSSTFSKEKIASLGEIVNRNIASSCMDARDFMAYEWKDDVPDCRNPLVCFNGCS